MSVENTITEHDVDAPAQQGVQGVRSNYKELEPDLAVDGLSDSILCRFIRLITFDRS